MLADTRLNQRRVSAGNRRDNPGHKPVADLRDVFAVAAHDSSGRRIVLLEQSQTASRRGASAAEPPVDETLPLALERLATGEPVD